MVLVLAFANSWLGEIFSSIISLADYVQCTVRHLKWTNCYSSPKIFLSHCWWISQQLWIKILINLQLGRRQTLSRLQEVTKLGPWGSSTVRSSHRGRIRGSWSGTLESTSSFWGLGFLVYTTVSCLFIVYQRTEKIKYRRMLDSRQWQRRRPRMVRPTLWPRPRPRPILERPPGVPLCPCAS